MNEQFLMLCLKYAPTSKVYIITIWIYGNFVCVQEFVKIYSRSPGCKLSAKTKCPKYGTQGTVLCNLVSYRKLLNFSQSYLLKLTETWSLISSKHGLYKWRSRFSLDTKWQDNAPWITYFCYFVLAHTLCPATLANFALCRLRIIEYIQNVHRVTHICVSILTIIGSDNGVSLEGRQVIIWTNAGILLILRSGTNFSQISIEIRIS